MNRNKYMIDADELKNKLGDKNLRLFDASLTDDVYFMGHIPGAVYFDHERFSKPNSPYMTTISPEDLLEKQIGAAGISNDSEVIVYACGMLPFAIRAWWVLRYAGVENVRVLNGGITAWKNAGGELEQESHSYDPVEFKARFTPQMFVGKDEVLSSLDAPDVAIVNVLPPVSYEARRIPGSVNVSCMDLMENNEFLLPNERLVEKLHAVAGNKRIITYCGGGIAATVNAMAHQLTGYNNVAVYDGSLFEWLGEKLPAEGDGKWEVWLQPA